MKVFCKELLTVSVTSVWQIWHNIILRINLELGVWSCLLRPKEHAIPYIILATGMIGNGLITSREALTKPSAQTVWVNNFEGVSVLNYKIHVITMCVLVSKAHYNQYFNVESIASLMKPLNETKQTWVCQLPYFPIWRHVYHFIITWILGAKTLANTCIYHTCTCYHIAHYSYVKTDVLFPKTYVKLLS